MYNDMTTLGLGDTAEHNKEEHAQVKKLVYEADTTSTASAGYDDVLARAVTAFLTHAAEEERDQLPLLVSKISAEDSDVRLSLISFRTR